jgi:hypothetical protein
MVIDFSKTEVFEGEMAQVCDCTGHVQIALPHSFQKLYEAIGIHFC